MAKVLQQKIRGKCFALQKHLNTPLLCVCHRLRCFAWSKGSLTVTGGAEGAATEQGVGQLHACHVVWSRCSPLLVKTVAVSRPIVGQATASAYIVKVKLP